MVAQFDRIVPAIGSIISVAVKQQVDAAPGQVQQTLTREAALITQLDRASRNLHIVRMIDGRQLDGMDCFMGSLVPNVWLDEVRRIIMEYCPMGSLEQLLERRINQ